MQALGSVELYFIILAPTMHHLHTMFCDQWISTKSVAVLGKMLIEIMDIAFHGQSNTLVFKFPRRLDAVELQT